MTLPKITISRSDRTRLIPVAIAALDRGVPAASVLLSEIDRAEIVADELVPQEVVGMHSEVEIRDNIGKATRRLRLAYPEEAAGDPGRVSVVSMLGAAVLGLSPGDSVDWCTATGDPRSVTVLHTSARPPQSLP